MPSSFAAFAALVRSREAIAAIEVATYVRVEAERQATEMHLASQGEVLSDDQFTVERQRFHFAERLSWFA